MVDFNQFTKEQFDQVIKFGKRSNVLFGSEVPMLIYFPYRFVKIDLPELLSSGNIEELIKLICEQQKIQIKEAKPKEVISFILWLKDEIEAIQQLESIHLNSTPDPDMIAAGVHELNELGEINVIDSLAGGDILKWAEIEKLPYHRIFDKLKKNTVESKVNKEYQKIVTRKRK